MKKLVQNYQSHSRSDHRTTLSRKQMIEARKEFIESQSKAKASPDAQLSKTVLYLSLTLVQEIRRAFESLCTVLDDKYNMYVLITSF